MLGILAWIACHPPSTAIGVQGDGYAFVSDTPISGAWSVEIDEDIVMSGRDLPAGTWLWTASPPTLLAGETEVPITWVTAAATLSGPPDLLLGDEPIALELSLPGMLGDVPLSAWVERTSVGASGTEVTALPGTCTGGVDTCVEEIPSDPAPLGESVVLGGWTVPLEEAREETWSVRLEARVYDGSEWRWHRILRADHQHIALGYQLHWGDLHGHSNLSWDGCELPDDGCAGRVELPGDDFFAQARDAGLSFAALTDHAEYGVWHPPDQADQIDIWSAQQERVAAEESEDFVSLLGFEWTWSGDKIYDQGTFNGGHKTVIFRDPEVCEDFRVASRVVAETFERPDGTTFEAGDNPVAGTPEGLYDAWDLGAATCGPEPLLAWFHHGTVAKPQAVDWENPINVPDARYERLVEIASEHGTFECMDPAAEGCDFRINEQVGNYIGVGSAQAALQQGFRLGFVGGTDCHDGRPGSLADGPSVQVSSDSEIGNEHSFPGALTGVLLPGAVLDRSTLFDGLARRRTLVTTGPTPDVRVVLVGRDGLPRLPGAVVERSGWPCVIRVEVDADVSSITLVGADNTILAQTDESTLSAQLDVAQRSAAYLRIDLPGDSPERIWVSPWFGGGG